VLAPTAPPLCLLKQLGAHNDFRSESAQFAAGPGGCPTTSG
jgi:hypothetical protein